MTVRILAMSLRTALTLPDSFLNVPLPCMLRSFVNSVLSSANFDSRSLVSNFRNSLPLSLGSGYASFRRRLHGRLDDLDFRRDGFSRSDFHLYTVEAQLK